MLNPRNDEGVKSKSMAIAKVEVIYLMELLVKDHGSPKPL